MAHIEKIIGNPDLCPSEDCRNCESFNICRTKSLESLGIDNLPSDSIANITQKILKEEATLYRKND
jgi:hypothetical protein